MVASNCNAALLVRLAPYPKAIEKGKGPKGANRE